VVPAEDAEAADLVAVVSAVGLTLPPPTGMTIVELRMSSVKSPVADVC
jgi:hypothetical protein